MRTEITEKDERIEHLEYNLLMCVQEKDKQIAEAYAKIDEYRKEIIEKDEEIRVLEASLGLRDKVLADYEIDWEMWRE